MKNDFLRFVLLLALRTWQDSKCWHDAEISNFCMKLLEQQPQNRQFIDSARNALKFQMRKVSHVPTKDTDFPGRLNSTDYYFLENFALTFVKVVCFCFCFWCSCTSSATIQTNLSVELFVLSHTTFIFYVFHSENVCSGQIFEMATGKKKLKCGTKSITQVNYKPSNIQMAAMKLRSIFYILSCS